MSSCVSGRHVVWMAQQTAPVGGRRREREEGEGGRVREEVRGRGREWSEEGEGKG